MPGSNRVESDYLQTRPVHNPPEGFWNKMGDVQLNRLNSRPAIAAALGHCTGDVRYLDQEQAGILHQFTKEGESVDWILDVLEDVEHADCIEIATGKIDLVQEPAFNPDAEF